MKKILVLLFLSIFLLTGCTKVMTGSEGETIVNEMTNTKIIDNIICKPNDKTLQNLYIDNGKDISALPECQNINILEWRGLYDTIFIYPIASIFIALGTLFGSYVFAIIILSILAKAIEIISSRNINRQNEILNKIRPEINGINERFKEKTDSASKMEKEDALRKLYIENNVKPMTGCLTILLQFPLLVAFIEVLYRVPVLADEYFLGINLATSPISGIKNGQLQYLLLVLLIIILAFLQSIVKTDKSKIQKRDLIMASIVVFIISSVIFSLPSGIAFYFLVSYLLNIILKIKTYLKSKNHIK